MTPSTLEQIAREKADAFCVAEGSAKGSPRSRLLQSFIMEALQTAAEPPEGADWAEAAAKELANELFPHSYGGIIANYATEKDAFTDNITAIICRHAPRPDEQRMREVLEDLKNDLEAYDAEMLNHSIPRTLKLIESVLAGQVAGGERLLIGKLATKLSSVLTAACFGRILSDKEKESTEAVLAEAEKLLDAAMRPEQPREES